MEKNINKEVEKLDAKNPCVICGITMGKEPHVGHLMLLTIAEQMQKGLGSKLPVFLVNNNTGPRAGGALVRVAEKYNLSLSEAAQLMNVGGLISEEIVSAYRNRSEVKEVVDEASKILESGEIDIFSKVSLETETILGSSGYTVEVVSEAKLVSNAQETIDKLNPSWSGTGFVPFLSGKRVVVLQKGGIVTATGAFLSSVTEISNSVNADLAVVVDSAQGVSDVAFVHTKAEIKGAGVQVFGAGVGFEGKIASGTKGEAMTIKEVAKRFSELRPEQSLKQAVLFLTLTRELYFEQGNKQIKDSFYGFKDNEDIIPALVEAGDKREVFVESVFESLESLACRVSSVSWSNDKPTNNFLSHLHRKHAALLLVEPDRVFSESKKQVNGVRQNYYFNCLKGMIDHIKKIDSITEEAYLMIGEMVEFCITRTGL